MENPNLEQARGYVQLLMQEGKLEDDIVKETASLFNLDKQAARRLIYDYKNDSPKLYRQNVKDNLRQKFFLLLFTTLAGGCYLFLLRKAGTIGVIFWPIVILSGLSAIGLLAYCIQLLRERYSLNRQVSVSNLGSNAEEKNKHTLTYTTVICGFLSLYASYQYFTKQYLLNEADFVPTRAFQLKTDCNEFRQSGRGGYTFYELQVTENNQTFRWKAQDHEYAFAPGNSPMMALKKGDTISMYIHGSDSYSDAAIIFIYDVKKDGLRMLDIPERNARSYRSMVKMVRILWAVFALLLLIVAGRRLYRQKKAPPQNQSPSMKAFFEMKN